MSKITRRDFLKTTAGAAAAGSLGVGGTLLSSEARSNDLAKLRRVVARASTFPESLMPCANAIATNADEKSSITRFRDGSASFLKRRMTSRRRHCVSRGKGASLVVILSWIASMAPRVEASIRL